MTNTDPRPRGVLTPADRAYLRGETDHDGSSTAREIRRRIRERTRNGLLDFSLLFRYMERRDRTQLLDVYGNVDDLSAYGSHTETAELDIPELRSEFVAPLQYRDPVFTGGLRQMLAFQLSLVLDLVIDQYDADPQHSVPLVKELVSDAFGDALATKGITANPQVEIELNRTDADLAALAHRADADESLTYAERQQLVYHREREYDELFLPELVQNEDS